MLPNITVVIWVTITSTRDVSHMVGYCLYRTLLLHLHWTACAIQIRAHHQIGVYSDMNERQSFNQLRIIAVCIYHLVMISIKWSETAQKMHWPVQM